MKRKFNLIGLLFFCLTFIGCPEENLTPSGSSDPTKPPVPSVMPEPSRDIRAQVEAWNQKLAADEAGQITVEQIRAQLPEGYVIVKTVKDVQSASERDEEGNFRILCAQDRFQLLSSTEVIDYCSEGLINENKAGESCAQEGVEIEFEIVE